MRLSYLAQDRLDFAETAKHLAQRTSKTREFDFAPLKRTAVGRPKVALQFGRQEHVDKITVFVDSDFAGDPVSRKSATGLVAQTGNHTVKSGSTFQRLAFLSVGEAEFYAAVKGGQVGQFLRSIFQDLEYVLGTSTSSRRRSQCQGGAYSEKLCRCWNEASLCFSTTTTLQVCRIGI